jgi:hypothetical protein
MATFSGMDAVTLAQFSVRISALEPEDIYLLDELKIGETFADVASVDPDFLQGDFNADGGIDLGDFTILADNLFDGTSYEQGDYDFNGQVDLSDFVLFRGAYAAANQAGAAVVPEPSGLFLLCVASLLFVVTRRRRHARG